MLLEDHGRAVLDADPLTALAEFREADFGEACLAEAGDAESRLGRARDAVDDYLAAHAVERVIAAVDRLSRAGRFDDAIALERALQARFGSGMLDEADLALAYDKIGSLDAAAAASLDWKANAAKRKAYERDAIRSYRHASDLAPFNEGYLLALGFAELQWGDRTSARAAFERELDLHPHQADAERGLAQLEAASPGRH
jgi:tetratricopeptide (TPR) repeat protein